MRHVAKLMAASAFAALLASAAQAQTPKDTIVMAKQIDDIITLDPAEAFEFSGVEVGANVYDILRREKLVLTKAGVEALEARLK